jgi:hypothetical protein
MKQRRSGWVARVDSLLLDPLVEFVLVEADELPDLEVVDPPLGDEASDESWADVEMVGCSVYVEKGHDREGAGGVSNATARRGCCRRDRRIWALGVCEEKNHDSTLCRTTQLRSWPIRSWRTTQAIRKALLRDGCRLHHFALQMSGTDLRLPPVAEIAGA